MLLLLVVVLLSTLSFEFFMVSSRFTSVNNIVMNTPRELFMVSIPLFQNDSEPYLYFDKSTLEKNVNDYYKNSVTNYVESYTVNFYYLNTGDKSMCLNNYCQAVELNFSAHVCLNVNYEKILQFQIEKGAKYGK